MLTVAQALDEILTRVKPLTPVSVAIDEALGQVLAEDITATENIPPFVNSAMDGFALRADNCREASEDHPIRLNVLGDEPAGEVSQHRIVANCALRIMTGAMLPEGADTVVPVEVTTSGANWVVINRPPNKGSHIRLAGEDVRTGELILAQGTPLRAAEIGLLAAVGRTTVFAYLRPRVAILTTGNELVDASQLPGPGQIRDANIHSLCAQVRATGAIPIPFPRVADRKESVRQAVEKAIRDADIILTNGGVSVGQYDFVKPVLDELDATRVFWQVQQKPGRPLAFWLLAGKPVFGLPGNPVSTMICFEEYVRPAIRKMMGFQTLFRPIKSAVLDHGYRKDADGRVHFLRVISREIAGELHASSTGPQGSGILSSLARANALAIIPEEAANIVAGDRVLLRMTDWPEDH